MRSRREAGTTCCDGPSERESQMNNMSLSTLRQVFGFPTDANLERQSTSVDCAQINSTSVGISALSLSVIPDIMHISKIKGMKGPLGSSIILKSVVSVVNAPENFS